MNRYCLGEGGSLEHAVQMADSLPTRQVPESSALVGGSSGPKPLYLIFMLVHSQHPIKGTGCVISLIFRGEQDGKAKLGQSPKPNLDPLLPAWTPSDHPARYLNMQAFHFSVQIICSKNTNESLFS